MLSLMITMVLLCPNDSIEKLDQFSISNITHGVITEKLKESRDFYVKHLDFVVVFENEWYVHLQSRNESRFQIAFLLPNHASQPPIFQPSFGGKGLFYTFEVANVQVLYERLTKAGVAITFPLTDEPWGERHFALYDPNGVALNISQATTTIKEEYQEGFKLETPNINQ